jgi:hypothetical protein
MSKQVADVLVDLKRRIHSDLYRALHKAEDNYSIKFTRLHYIRLSSY